jgi:hypothetical protein
MIILTGANADSAKTDSGHVYKNFSFRGVIQRTVDKAREFGYTPVVYDLGNLGMGEPLNIDDKTFNEKGYYEKEVIKGYKSKSLFKPRMVRTCMNARNDLIIYLDGDAQLCDSLEEVEGDDFDVGVTLRDPDELESEWHQEHMEIVKYINAGVIFFNPTPATKLFIDEWEKCTEEVGNDQMALNKLTCPEYYPEPYSILTINGVRIKYFPCMQFNYYYFDEKYEPNIKVMHFKGSVRHFYPFNNTKRLYCKFIVPIKNKIRNIVKF